MFKNGILLLCVILFAQNANSQQSKNEPAEGASLSEWADYYAHQAKAERAIVEKYAREKGILIDHYLPDGKVMTLRRIEPDGTPTYIATDNVEAATTISTNKVWSSVTTSGLNLSGRGLTIGEWDGGQSRLTHQDYEGRVVQQDNSTMAVSDHATHVGGTLVAGGIMASAKGMSYQAFLKTHDWDNDDAEMTDYASQGGMVSNHSYGFTVGWSDDGTWTGGSTPLDYRNGYYNSNAQAWDNIAYNAPYYLICKSSGNSNGGGPANDPVHPQNGPYDCISLDGNAKNIMTVGAVNILSGGYTTANAVQIAGFSSTGPSDDGRIKPDIMGCGINVYSLWSTSDAAYANLQGTSMSSPNVAGSCLLLQEYYANTHNSKRMKSATLKGLVIHTADECGTTTGPDYRFGWGLMNTLKAANVIKEDNYTSKLKEDTMQNLQVKEYAITALGGKPLVATVCWTDRRGTPGPAVVNNRTAMLVNDLDVRIIRDSPSDTTFPWKLNVEAPSAAATRADNKVDNVEKVEIASPVAGATYKIRITHKNNLFGTTAAQKVQPYSLIVSGIVEGDTSRTCRPMQKVNSATGRFDDGSGSSRKYAHGSDCKWLINPADSAAKIRIILRNFSVDNSDTLIMYDGASTSDPILAKRTGTFPLDTIFSTGHQVLVNFKSDAVANSTGWEIDYKAFARPKFDFISNATNICAGSSVSFAGQAKSTDVEGWLWTWSLPGASDPAPTGKTTVAVYPTPGVYTVTCKVTNLFGPGFEIKEDYITVKPTTVSNLIPYSQGFESTTFPVDPTNSELNWEITPDASTWNRTAFSSFSGVASMRIKNNQGKIYTRQLTTPGFDITSIPAADRIVSYRMAYARKNTSTTTDKLSIQVSTNCGRSWTDKIVRTNTSVPPLSTIGIGAGDIISGTFIPSSESQWRKDSVSLSSLSAGLTNVLVRFQMQSDNGGYLYLDDIKIGNLVLGVDGKFVAKGLGIDIFPNPGNEATEISVSGLTQGPVRLQILDVLGKSLGEVSLDGNSEGTANSTIGTLVLKIESGIYLIRATSGQSSITKRFVIQ